MHRRSFLTTLGACLPATAALSACSGGVFIGIGDDDDAPAIRPTISLSAAPTRFTSSGVLVLTTSVTAQRPVAEVRFYQLSGNTPLLLDTRRAPPYQTALPIDASYRGTLFFYASVTDAGGYSADSPLVAVDVDGP